MEAVPARGTSVAAEPTSGLPSAARRTLNLSSGGVHGALICLGQSGPMERPRTEPRERARDAGLARLRRTTRVTIFGATALAGAFAALAAHSAPGHKAGATVTSFRRSARQTQARTSTRTATQAKSDDQTQVQSQA